MESMNIQVPDQGSDQGSSAGGTQPRGRKRSEASTSSGSPTGQDVGSRVSKRARTAAYFDPPAIGGGFRAVSSRPASINVSGGLVRRPEIELTPEHIFGISPAPGREMGSTGPPGLSSVGYFGVAHFGGPYPNSPRDSMIADPSHRDPLGRISNGKRTAPSAGAFASGVPQNAGEIGLGTPKHASSIDSRLIEPPSDAAPLTFADFTFVGSSIHPATITPSKSIPFRRPLGIILTQHALKPHKIFQIRIALDFPGQECNYHISQSSTVYEHRYEITLILSIHGRAISAMDRKTFPDEYDWQRGIVVDCGGQSGFWVCEFPQMGHGAVSATEIVDVLVEEEDYGEY